MDHAAKKTTILEAVKEIDRKMLDATIETVNRRLKKRGFDVTYYSTNRILRDLVSEGDLCQSDMGLDNKTNKYFPAAKQRMMA